MNQVVIENLILNFPFAESGWHLRIDDEGSTAVDNTGTWDRRVFIEIPELWDAQNTIRVLLATALRTAKGDPHANAA